jgi:hypothetical protein
MNGHDRSDPPRGRVPGWLSGIGSALTRRNQIPALPPVRVQPPPTLLPGWNPDQPPELAAEMSSPFVRDTLSPWLGVTPAVGTAELSPHEYGAVHPAQPGRVAVNAAMVDPARRPGEFSSAPAIGDVLTHEYAHSAGLRRGHPIRETHQLFQDSAAALSEGRKRLLPSGGNPEEMRAHAIEAAMREIRSGARSPEEINSTTRYYHPGVEAAFEWLMSRANQGGEASRDRASGLGERNSRSRRR